MTVTRWDGEAHNLGEFWKLTKGGHMVACTLYTHPIGAEIRALIDDELWRTQADRDLGKLSDLANEWREQFKEKVWQ